MNLTTLSFLYICLPVMLAVFLLLPKVLRPGALLFFSLAYYGLLYPWWLPVLAAGMALDFLAVRLLLRLTGKKMRRVVLLFSLAKSGGLLFWAGVTALEPRAGAVTGALVCTLSGVDAVAAAFRGEAPKKAGPVRLGAYLSFFPRLAAGPLLPWGEFDAQLSNLSPGPADLAEGLCLFLIGGVKYLLPGGYLGVVYETVRLYGGDATVLSHWCMVVTLALSVYYLYGGLCDMAVGLGRMLGLRLPENFRYPYQSRGVLDFFGRFNATLGAFLRRHVYKNLRGERENPPAEALSMLLVGMLLGLWFGLRVNRLAWGAFLAVCAILERYLLAQVLERIPTLFWRLGTLFVVLVSFVLFAGDSLLQSWGYFRGLFGLGAIELYNNRILYLLTANWALLLLSCLFATNLFGFISGGLRKALPRVHMTLTTAACPLLLVLVTALIIH